MAMKKWFKQIIILFLALIAIMGAVVGAIKVLDNLAEKRKVQEEIMEQDRIMWAYLKLNYSFHLTTGVEFYTEARHLFENEYKPYGVYLPLSEITPDFNKYNIDFFRYLIIKMYVCRTDNTLSYDTVIDYFSEEYEPDGSLRLYNNGLHPEIEAYVEWMWGRRNEQENYIRTLEEIYADYFIANRDNGFIYQTFPSLSPQMYDELVKKEADPDYEMDLLSLQQQGY